METFQRTNIFSLWLNWHFFEMPGFLFSAWKNYFLFSLNYFSIILLLKTFFAPWRRYNWSYPRGFDVGEWLSTFLSNIFSRVIGAICRTVLIIMGIIAQILIIFAGPIVILFWVLIPFIIIFAFIFIAVIV